MIPKLRRKTRGALALLLAAIWVGCSSGGDQPPAEPKQPPFAGQRLTLLVVDDPRLAAAVRRMSGEWAARTGAELTVSESTIAVLEQATSLAGDAVIYPSSHIGLLTARKWIAPVPESLLQSDALQWRDVFESLRCCETTWGRRVYALPFGSPTLVCYYRRDLFERFGKSPPQTWEEYGRLAEFFQDRQRLGEAAPAGGQPWFGAAEPLAEGQAAWTLLSRAAPYARHPDYFSTLFDLDSMAPQIAAPPFVRALEELVAANKFGPDVRQTALGVVQSREAVLSGRCAMALCWPRPAAAVGEASREDSLSISVAELPGAEETYHPSKDTFVRGALRRVPLLSAAGRLGSVSAKSQHQEAALEALISLCSPEWSVRISGASRATTLFRASQVKAPTPWVSGGSPQEAAAYAQAAQGALNGREVIFPARIPGHARYLKALDQAVRQAVSGEQTPREALEAAARQWSKITEELGLDAQRDAYKQSVVRLF